MPQSNDISNDTFAVVFAVGGEEDDYVACETQRQVDFAVNEFEGFGAKVAVFYRKDHAPAAPRVVNSVTGNVAGTGTFIMADTIHGGVWR